MIKEFKGGGDHYGNFVEAVRSRKAETLNADAFQGHLSAALAHLANISYYLGEKQQGLRRRRPRRCWRRSRAATTTS